MPNSNAIALFYSLTGYKNDVNIEQLLAPSPMGIAVMGQLMICASRTTDIRIDQRPGSLMRHPESFRTTLVQIGNDAHTAFMKAHSNMEQIQIQMAQVPGYVQESVDILKSKKKVAIEKMLPRRLALIKKAATEGESLSQEVSTCFDQLIELIKQVLKATSASIGFKEQQLEAQIRAVIEEDRKRQLDIKVKEQANIESQRSTYNILAVASQGIVGLASLLTFNAAPETAVVASIVSSLTTDSIKIGANKRLRDIKLEAEKAIQEIKNIEEEYTEKLENLHIDVKEDITRDAAIKTLQEGMGYLVKLQTNWSGMASFFKTVKTNIVIVTEKLETFELDAQAVIEDVSIMNTPTLNTIEAQACCYVIHRVAELYVKVSSRYIVGNVAAILEMAALEDDKIEEAQQRLKKSCKEASKGIKEMVVKEKSELIESIELFNTNLIN